MTLLLAHAAFAAGVDLASARADRAAIEHVYHAHRTGAKLPFEQAMPTSLLERLVREDLKKQAVLARVYGVEVTPAMVAAEVRRIDTTTRAPDILAEIKAALGNDAQRFAAAFARPIVVERLLREKYDYDDALHAPLRRIAEATRAHARAVPTIDFDARLAALKASTEGTLQDTVEWTLTPRPVEDTPAPTIATPKATTGKASSGAYHLEATAQLSQVLSAPETVRDGREPQFYFEDLPVELQNVLNAQLRQPGDVSAVIETPRAFLLYLARARSADTLNVAVLTISKRAYEDWLAQQPDP